MTKTPETTPLPNYPYQIIGDKTQAAAQPSRECLQQSAALQLAVACAGDWEAVRPHLVVQMLRDQHDRVAELEALQAAPPAPAAVAVPEGFALMPKRLTRAMEKVLSADEEGWQWEDLLAAAEAITEEEYAALAAATAQAYSIDADPQGIRAYVADAITGALACGAQGSGTPPPGHWLTPFWQQARFGQIQYNALRGATDALLNAPGAAQEHATQLTGQGRHPDDEAVDALAAAMKAKLARQREKGYGGWGSEECTQQRLSDMLRAHVDKGDPVDVANFCAFLKARREGIAPAQAQEDARDLEAEALRACRDLPEDWEIEIHLERGYGVVTVIDPQGNDDELPVEGTLFDALKESIDTAIRDDAARAAQGGAA